MFKLYIKVVYLLFKWFIRMDTVWLENAPTPSTVKQNLSMKPKSVSDKLIQCKCKNTKNDEIK